MSRRLFALALTGLILIPGAATAYGWRWMVGPYYAVPVLPAYYYAPPVYYVAPCSPVVEAAPRIIVPIAPPQVQVVPSAHTEAEPLKPEPRRAAVEPTPTPLKPEPRAVEPTPTPEPKPTRFATPKPASPPLPEADQPMIPAPAPRAAVEPPAIPKIDPEPAPAAFGTREVPPIAIPKPMPVKPMLDEPKIPSPAVPEVSSNPDPNFPSLRLGMPRPVESSESRSSPLTGNGRPTVDVIRVAGTASPNGLKQVGFYNRTNRDVVLTVQGESVKLPKWSFIRANVPAGFVWRMNGEAERKERVPADVPGVEVVIRP